MSFIKPLFVTLCAAGMLQPGMAAAQQSVPAATATEQLAALPASLKDVKWATDKKPNLKAKYYIYLISASWCGPCSRLMPQIVKAYKTDMKEGKLVEVILTACEQRKGDVPAYLEKYGAGFPGIHITAPEVQRFAGFDRNDMRKGIPFVVICDRNGNVLDKGHGAFGNWKETIKKDIEAKKAARN